jgi:succinate dehydrogenase / fumarate reductase membrane anchor subunit
MLWHYITGLGILIAGAVHLATVFFTAPVEANLSFDAGPFSVIGVYRNLLLAASLEALLIFVAFHGFNGLRVILLELYQSPRWDRAVNWALLIIGALITLYGTRTVLLAYAIGGLG